MNEWNREKLEETGLMNSLCKIQNCVRGSYTNAETYEALAEKLHALADELNRCAADVFMIAEDDIFWNEVAEDEDAEAAKTGE